jgi:alpha-ketoglutarate-dependent taurine dioxygenase
MDAPSFYSPRAEGGNGSTATRAADAGGLLLDSVRISFLPSGNYMPLLLQSAVKGVALQDWMGKHREFIEAQLDQSGSVLFRGFGIETADELSSLIKVLAGEPLEYQERSSPRTQVGDNVYTSTDYPARKSIILHNENSYQNVWPLKTFFLCITPATSGGETPLADCRRVLARLSPQTHRRFKEKKWMLVRNFNDGFGLTWQSVFQTDDTAEAERHCRANQIDVEWKDGQRLRTKAIRTAIVKHPRTGEYVWFNHALFFHISSVEAGMREALLAEFDEYDLPSNTFYGDGEPVEPHVIEEVREAYRQETVAFKWERGDMLVLDNMLVAHGRSPYVGARQILVGMAQPVRRHEVEGNDANGAARATNHGER